MSSNTETSAVTTTPADNVTVLPSPSTGDSVLDYKRNSSDTKKTSEADTVTVPDATDVEAQPLSSGDWKPSKHEKAVIYTLAITNLIVALDATIVITPLSVSSRYQPPPPPEYIKVTRKKKP